MLRPTTKSFRRVETTAPPSGRASRARVVNFFILNGTFRPHRAFERSRALAAARARSTSRLASTTRLVVDSSPGRAARPASIQSFAYAPVISARTVVVDVVPRAWPTSSAPPSARGRPCATSTSTSTPRVGVSRRRLARARNRTDPRRRVEIVAPGRRRARAAAALFIATKSIVPAPRESTVSGARSGHRSASLAAVSRGAGGGRGRPKTTSDARTRAGA